jgi:succinylglutamate desuccinylase
VWVWALVRLQEGWKLPLHLDVNNYTALHKGLLLRLRSVADNLPHRQTLSADR